MGFASSNRSSIPLNFALSAPIQEASGTSSPFGSLLNTGPIDAFFAIF